MSKINAGIIGVGSIGHAQIEAIRRLGFINVAAIVVRDEERAQEACSNLSIPKYYTDYRELLSNPEIEVIHNCTPNNVHYQINKDVILAKKHLLSEKPLTIHASESEELVLLAAKYHIFNGVNFVYRHFSVIQHLHQIIAMGELGDIFAIHGSYLQDWLLYETDYNWRVNSTLAGPSRAVADIGSHWCDMAQFLIGSEINEVVADLSTFIPERKKPIDTLHFDSVSVTTEDFGSVLLKFRNGVKGCFTVSQVSAGRKSEFSFQVDGSKASAYWNQECPYQLWLGYRNKPNEVLLSHPSLLVDQAKSYNYYPSGSCERWPDAQKDLIKNFYESILNEKEIQYATFNDAHKVNLIIEAVLRSNTSRNWQQVQ
jgi:predicted dehydrogenase